MATRLFYSWLAVSTARSMLLATGTMLPMSLFAQARPETPEIRTAATAERSVPPDLAIVTLQFFAQGPTPSEAGHRLAAKADSLRRALATIGIPIDSMVNRSRSYWWRGRIETVLLPVRYIQRDTPSRRYSEPIQDTAYRAHDAIQVRIRDMAKVGAVVDTAIGRQITDISNIEFRATSVTAAREEALQEATVHARRQAEAIAGAAGMELGAVLSLATQPDYTSGYDWFSMRDYVSVSGAVDQGNTGTVIVQPAVPVTVTVYARWALVKKP